MRRMFDRLLAGARPDLDTLIEVFADAVPSLRQLKDTPQDPEWHGEGDVHRHTSMVLEELYRELDSPLGAELSPLEKQELVLGAVFHDLAKPWTTRHTEVRGTMRVTALRHEAKGRSALASALVDLGLPWDSLWQVMSLVGSHHEPKLLVVKERGPGEYRRISRRVDPRRVAFLARADMRGRICPDRERQIEHVELFALGAEEYCPSGWHEAWRRHFAASLDGRPPAFQDRVFGEAIRAAEAGRIREPEEGFFLAFQEPAAPPELVVTCGLSGSGKSTFVEKFLGDHERISLDELRDDLAGDRSDQALNGAVRQEAKLRLKTALRPGRKVVWDATCLRKDFRSAVCEIGLAYGALVTLVVFQLRPELCAARNRARSHAVPATVLASQVEQWEWPEVDEAHRLLVLDGNHQVRGDFGICGESLPWGLLHAPA
jgi:predicted kinase